MSHTHWEGGPTCSFSTKKACDDNFANWQAAQQVALAQRVVREGRAGHFRKGNDVFSQLVQVINGDKQTITAGDGEESQNAFTRRILAMLERYREENPPVER